MQRDESSQWKKPIPIQSALIQQPCGTDLLQSYLSIGEYTAAWQVFDTLVKDLSHLSSTNARQLLVLLHNDVLQLPSDPRLVIMWTKRLQSLWLQSNRWSHDDIAAAIESYGRLGKLAHAEALYATIDPHSKTKTSSHSTLTTTIANKMLGAYLRQWKYSDTHQQQQYLDRMLVIFDSMVSPRTRKKKRPVADIVTYNHILAAHIKMNNWESAERWFLQVMVPSGLHFKRTTFHMLLQGAIRHHQRPQQWIEHMANAGLRPNRQTFKHILLGLASQATHFARVQQWYGLQTTCTSLHECFDIMQKWKYKPSTLLVNAMLSTALLANHESLANELLSRLGLLSSLSVPHQCHPDVATFNILVHHALCQTNLPLAESWYQRMRHEFDLRPDYVTYGMLINHHLQHREIDVALQYLDDMARHGLEPNTVINNMLWKARDHLSISMRLPTQPLDNIVACNQSLSIAWQPNDEKGTLERLDGVVKAMAAHNLTPNQRTINTTLDIHGKLLAEIMASHTPVESEPDDDYSLFETSDVDISNGGKRQSPAALSLQDIGIKESPTADTITYALRIRNAVYQQDLPKAEATLRAMSDAGVLPNSFVFAHLVHGYAQQGLLNKAHSILHLMNQAPYHVKPTSHVFAPLVDAYSKAGDVDKAHRLFKDMTDIGIEPDVPMYTILARLFVKHGSPLEAIQVLRDLPLDTHAQGVLMEAYGKVAQFVKKSSRQEYIQLVQKLYVSMPEHAMVDTIYLTALGRLVNAAEEGEKK
ncbi:hypothetical protein DM01DRAFT_1118599 [Hesseltinella vesiculosa]|uniref:PROP1-like PPR domain-containing protein n=1 Tax=Hesseltinella vesiculosa TaxID=101127 RepID=A0A1X2GTJ8_9FUNG|nr:hypothetical protein DM01DRAFT_1118599 [Hesseltinella vesiculosa]